MPTISSRTWISTMVQGNEQACLYRKPIREAVCHYWAETGAKNYGDVLSNVFNLFMYASFIVVHFYSTFISEIIFQRPIYKFSQLRFLC